MANQRPQDVADYLQQLRRLQETKVKFLSEQVPPASPAPSNLLPTEPPPDPAVVDAVPPSGDVSQEATADIQKGMITLEMVVEKFNAIRSGRSFKDKTIKQQMMQYFDKLTDEEKVALYAFMKGIAQIVTGEFAGYSPVSPSSVGAPASAPEIPPSEGAEAAPAEPPPAEPSSPSAPPPTPPPAPVKKVIKTIKPNIIKKQAPPTNVQAGNAAAPIPITPKVR